VDNAYFDLMESWGIGAETFEGISARKFDKSRSALGRFRYVVPFARDLFPFAVRGTPSYCTVLEM
jgi:hypothetical protein